MTPSRRSHSNATVTWNLISPLKCGHLVAARGGLVVDHYPSLDRFRQPGTAVTGCGGRDAVHGPVAVAPGSTRRFRCSAACPDWRPWSKLPGAPASHTRQGMDGVVEAELPLPSTSRHFFVTTYLARIAKQPLKTRTQHLHPTHPCDRLIRQLFSKVSAAAATSLVVPTFPTAKPTLHLPYLPASPPHPPSTTQNTTARPFKGRLCHDPTHPRPTLKPSPATPQTPTRANSIPSWPTQCRRRATSSSKRTSCRTSPAAR